MPATILVTSDLHLSDGNRRWEPWGEAQQAAFEALLAAARPGGALADTTVELVLNGDTFDFLLAQPSLGARTATDVNVAHAKWAAIVAAHERWFVALHEFLRYPNHRVTFTVGNHDLELLYPSIRARVRSAINAPPGMVRFCLTRAYQPVPDVVIEHGCQYDPWNAIPLVWDRVPLLSTAAQLERSDQRSAPVGPMQLPWGSRYFYHVFLPIKERLPYSDALVPALSITRQIALLSLLAPDLLLEATTRTRDLLTAPSEPLPAIPDDKRRDPLTLFSLALLTMQATLHEIFGAAATDTTQTQALEFEVVQLHHALEQERETALQIILGPHLHSNPQAPAATQTLLIGLPVTHLALIGHTHVEGRWARSQNQALLDTGTWSTRYAAPTVDEWNATLMAWFADPLTEPYPGRDASRFTMAWIRSDSPVRSVAELVAWQDGTFAIVPDNVLA